jgi:hypothetical protein
VGEIGITRKEFLYELKLKDIILITRGYFRRHHPGWEQARFIAYHAAHCMGSKHTPPPVSQWWPLPWEKDDLPNDDEVNEMREKIRRENEMKENGES